DPTISFVRSYPVTFLTVLPPVLRTFPSAVTISSPITKSLVTPYLTPRGPPAFSARFPPMVHIEEDEGSGGYIRLCASASLCMSPVLTPGLTLMIRSSGYISNFVSHCEKSSTMPPWTGKGPPDRLVLAPRAQTG